MARYVYKKKKKLARKFGGTVNGLAPLTSRAYPPGQHGRRRRKLSEYAKGLQNKNHLRASYNISQRQFANYYRLAQKQEDTGATLVLLLETRLDNLVYRLGIAPTLAAARQLVVHGHIEVQKLSAQTEESADAEVTFERVSCPGYRVKAKQKIRLREKTQKKLPPMIEGSLQKAERLPYVSYEASSFTGFFAYIPEPEEIAPLQVIETAKIIEFSSRRIKK